MAATSSLRWWSTKSIGIKENKKFLMDNYTFELYPDYFSFYLLLEP